MSESTGDGTLDQLSVAAQLVGAVPGVGDGLGYLRAYYRHVPQDELAPAPRLAAVAAEHARLARRRPPGQAALGVRARGVGADGEDPASLDPGSDVIDIVTDDMPFLVDSITMELADRPSPAARPPDR